jgi:hypothetical protein
MTKEDIIRLAREAGFSDHSSPEMWGVMVASHEEIERFAALVAKVERDAVCQIFLEWCICDANGEEIVSAIRARGNK